MLVTIDRFEGDSALVETEEREIIGMPKKLLPGAKEGDVVRIEIDEEKTLSRREEIKALADRLFE